MTARDTANFKISEFFCPHCGKGSDVIKQQLIDALQKIRTDRGLPMSITSGYRCEEHNRAIHGAVHSAHLEGSAADVSDPQGKLKVWMAPRLEDYGLWMESPKDTPSWCHLQIRPVAGGRIFRK